MQRRPAALRQVLGARRQQVEQFGFGQPVPGGPHGRQCVSHQPRTVVLEVAFIAREHELEQCLDRGRRHESGDQGGDGEVVAVLPQLVQHRGQESRVARRVRGRQHGQIVLVELLGTERQDSAGEGATLLGSQRRDGEHRPAAVREGRAGPLARTAHDHPHRQVGQIGGQPAQVGCPVGRRVVGELVDAVEHHQGGRRCLTQGLPDGRRDRRRRRLREPLDSVVVVVAERRDQSCRQQPEVARGGVRVAVMDEHRRVGVRRRPLRRPSGDQVGRPAARLAGHQQRGGRGVQGLSELRTGNVQPEPGPGRTRHGRRGRAPRRPAPRRPGRADRSAPRNRPGPSRPGRRVPRSRPPAARTPVPARAAPPASRRRPGPVRGRPRGRRPGWCPAMTGRAGRRRRAPRRPAC